MSLTFLLRKPPLPVVQCLSLYRLTSSAPCSDLTAATQQRVVAVAGACSPPLSLSLQSVVVAERLSTSVGVMLPVSDTPTAAPAAAGALCSGRCLKWKQTKPLASTRWEKKARRSADLSLAGIFPTRKNTHFLASSANILLTQHVCLLRHAPSTQTPRPRDNNKREYYRCFLWQSRNNTFPSVFLSLNLSEFPSSSCRCNAAERTVKWTASWPSAGCAVSSRPYASALSSSGYSPGSTWTEPPS